MKRVILAAVFTGLTCSLSLPLLKAGIPGSVENQDVTKDLQKLKETDWDRYVARCADLLKSNVQENVLLAQSEYRTMGAKGIDALKTIDCDSSEKLQERVKPLNEFLVQDKIDADIVSETTKLLDEYNKATNNGKKVAAPMYALADLQSKHAISESRMRANLEKLPENLRDLGKKYYNANMLKGGLRIAKRMPEPILKFNDLAKQDDTEISYRLEEDGSIHVAVAIPGKLMEYYSGASFDKLKETQGEIVDKYKITKGGIGEDKLEGMNGGGRMKVVPAIGIKADKIQKIEKIENIKKIE